MIMGLAWIPMNICIIVTSVDAADAQADLSVPCPHMS